MLPRDLPARLARDGYCGSDDESEWRGLEMRVFSRPKIVKYIPCEREICISIVSRGEPAVALALGWWAVHRIECDDTGQFAANRGDALPLTQQDARAVLEFVSTYREARRVVVQCHAGVSRSRSLAAALAEQFGLPYRWTVFNADMLAAIRRAAQDRGAGAGEEA